MRISFLLLFLTCIHASFAQITISGRILQPDSTALPYVNIGIKLKDAGTLSNEKGEFQLLLPRQFSGDTITFASVGFEDLQVPVQLILDSSKHVFVLMPKTAQLAEVTVTNKQTKQKTIGIRSHNPFLSGTAESKSRNDIIEFAKFINIDKASRIETVHVYLFGINIDTATFRINFYDVKDGLPGDKIIDKNILERTSVKKGWLTVDVTRENITTDKDFYISFEFIPEQKLSKYSLMYGAQVGGNCIVRTSSFGNWVKQKGASLSAYVTVRQ